MPDTDPARPPIVRNDGRVDVAPDLSYPSFVDPDEVVVYRADAIGDFSRSLYVVMSDNAEFGAWEVATFSRLTHPEHFDKRRGLAITSGGNERWLEYLCEPAPGANQPLTELGED